MSKYDPLREKLLLSNRDRVTMSFHEIDTLVGGLPPSAHDYRAWWSNERQGSHVHAHAWMSAGYRVEAVDQVRGVVRFVRL